MSHFSVLVVTRGDPSALTDNKERALDVALKPFHEFECTGMEFNIVDVDITDEKRSDYEKDSNRYYVFQDGTRIHEYDESLYRDATPEEVKKIKATNKDRGEIDGKTFTILFPDSCRIKEPPEGAELKELRSKDIKSFREWLEENDYKCIQDGEEPILDRENHKYGYGVYDSNGEIIKVVRRTNAKRHRWISPEGVDHGVFIGDAMPLVVTETMVKALKTRMDIVARFGTDGKEYGEIRAECHDLATAGWKRLTVGGPKWDWYTVGGRFGGMFLSPVGSETDAIQVADIDVEKLLERARSEFADRWDTEEREYNENPSRLDGRYRIRPLSIDEINRETFLRSTSEIPDGFDFNQEFSLEEIPGWFYRNGMTALEVLSGTELPFSDARAAFHAIVIASREKQKTTGEPLYKIIDGHRHAAELRKASKHFGIDSQYITKESYVDSARAIAPFAFLKDGVWHERGRMGWWACVSDERDRDEWQVEVDAMLASLKPTDWITCVDCHI